MKKDIDTFQLIVLSVLFNILRLAFSPSGTNDIDVIH